MYLAMDICFALHDICVFHVNSVEFFIHVFTEMHPSNLKQIDVYQVNDIYISESKYIGGNLPYREKVKVSC
jgi:hypothetical protein